MPQFELGAASEVAGLAVVGGDLHHLVQSRQCLIGLVPRQLDGRDPQADLGIVRFEFQSPEIFRQGLVGPSHGLEQAAQGEMGLGTVGVDLDRGLESLECGRGIGPLRLDLPQADQGLDIIGVALEGGTEAGLRLGQPALELQDRAQPLLRLGRSRGLGNQLQQRQPGLFVDRRDRSPPGPDR